MSGSNFTSREAYGAPLTQPAARGPDPRATTQVSNALAQGFAEVSSQYAQLWARADNAQQVADATGIVAKQSMALADMQRGFDADPDPRTVPTRFKEAAATLRADTLKDLAPGVQQHVARQLDQMLPTAYRQVIASAYQRHIGNLRGGLATTLGTNAQAIAGATDEPQLLERVQAAKQSIAGNVQAGVIQEADARPLFSNAIRQAVTIRAAADPVAAQALLERFKGEMDAADVAALTTGLRAPLEQRQGEDAAAGSIAGSGGAAGIVDAIMAQESGGRDGLVSVDGARGRMQIMPGTWAQYARPGEAIDNPEHNRAVGERIIADLAFRAGGDPARIAVGYFSGPGNIAPFDSPTPWKEDRRDGNGMTVSRYVAQVTARLAPAGTTAAQGEAALTDVRARLADAPLHVRLSAESQVAQHFSRVDAQLGQQRAVLGQQLRDLEALYGVGQTATAIPESQIRALLPHDQAERTVASLNLARATGDAVSAVAFASPQEALDHRARLAGDPADTYLAAERLQMVGRFDAAWAARRKMLADDPAGYAAQAPELRALVAAGASRQEIAAASLDAQFRMGVPRAQRRVLSDSQVTQIAETLRTTGPEKADMGETLAGMAQQFGPALWNRAYGELVQHGKIGEEWQAVAMMTHPAQSEGRALLQRALVFQSEKGGPEALRKLVAPNVMKGFDVQVDGALTKFREATRHHPGGDSLFNTVRRAITTLATYHAYRGASAADATQRAYQDVIGARFDTAGDDGSGLFGRTPTMLVPKGRGGDIETALERRRLALQPGDLAPLPNSGQDDAARRANTHAAAQRGYWINNADASGAVLVLGTPGGGFLNVSLADGSPVEVLFDRLPTLSPAAVDQLELQDSRDAARALRERSR